MANEYCAFHLGYGYRRRRRRRRRWRHLDFGGGHRRDGVFEDQLFLIVCFENDGVFIESFDLPDQFDPADEKNRDGQFFPPDRVEVDILDILGRCFVLHVRNSLKKLRVVRRTDEPCFLYRPRLPARQTT